MVASKPKGESAVPSVIFSAFKVSDKSYAQLSSLKTQPAAAAGKAIGLEQIDGAVGVTHEDGTITVKEAGVYFAVAAGQVGSAKAGKGTVKLWMRQNAKDVDNSNTEQTAAGGSTSVVVCQGVMELKAGDKIQVMQSAKGRGLGMVATTPKGEPAIPSVIFSLVRID